MEEAMASLGPYDIMCGRHKEAFNNIGNRRFRITVSMFLQRYHSAHSRLGKSQVIHEIMGIVHATGGRFVKYNDKTKSWKALDKKACYEKTGHALRDMSIARSGLSSDSHHGGVRALPSRRSISLPIPTTLRNAPSAIRRLSAPDAMMSSLPLFRRHSFGNLPDGPDSLNSTLFRDKENSDSDSDDIGSSCSSDDGDDIMSDVAALLNDGAPLSSTYDETTPRYLGSLPERVTSLAD